MIHDAYFVVKTFLLYPQTYGKQTIYGPTVFLNTKCHKNLHFHGRVNEISSIEDIVMLNENSAIYSPIAFDEISSPVFNTNGMVQGRSLEKWNKEVLWRTGYDEQRVEGNWKIDNLVVDGEIYGNGLINQKPIREMEAKLRNNIEVIEKTITNHSSDYMEMCYHLQNLAKESSRANHILKYFELDFKITQDKIISYFYFGEFFAINSGCKTTIYKWMKNDEHFDEIGSAETGVVDDWKVLQTRQGEIFVIIKTNSKSKLSCIYGSGLNLWKFQDYQLIHDKTILVNADNIVEMHVNLNFNDRFFILDSNDVITSYSVNSGEIRETWALSRDYSKYSFVDLRASSDIMLSNGRKIVNLESKFKSRKTRTFFPDADTPVMNVHKFPGRDGNSDVYVLRHSEAPVNFQNRSTPAIPPATKLPANKKDDFIANLRSLTENLRNGVRKTTENLSRYANKTKQSQISAKLKNTSRHSFKIKNDNFTNVLQELKSISQVFQQNVQRARFGKIVNESVGIAREESIELEATQETTIEADVTSEIITTETINVDTISSITETTTGSSTTTTISDEIQSAADESNVPVKYLGGGGIREAENTNFPERGAGEFLLVLVGPQYKALHVVSRVRDATIKKNQNSIVVSKNEINLLNINNSIYLQFSRFTMIFLNRMNQSINTFHALIRQIFLSSSFAMRRFSHFWKVDERS